jgi:DNA-binding CsgD family transcriptional regulator
MTPQEIEAAHRAKARAEQKLKELQPLLNRARLAVASVAPRLNAALPLLARIDVERLVRFNEQFGKPACTLADPNATDEERDAAARAFAAELSPKLARRAAFRGARALALDTNRDVRDLIGDLLVPAILAAGRRAGEPQFVRFGRRWETRAGRKALVRPVDLSLGDLAAWLAQQAYAAAAEMASGTDPLTAERVEAPPRSREAVGLLALSQRAGEAARLLRHRQPSPRQREILHRLKAGDSIREVADALGISASTVRTQLHRLRHRM